MSKEELIDAFECGDMGRIEFFELGLEAGLSVKEIGDIIERADES